MFSDNLLQRIRSHFGPELGGVLEQFLRELLQQIYRIRQKDTEIPTWYLPPINQNRVQLMFDLTRSPAGLYQLYGTATSNSYGGLAEELKQVSVNVRASDVKALLVRAGEQMGENLAIAEKEHLENFMREQRKCHTD